MTFLYGFPIFNLHLPKPLVMKIFTCLFGFLIGVYTLNAQWEWQNPYPHGNDLNEVFCLNQCEGWVVGKLGSIIKTTDGGITFYSMECPVQVNLNSVEFFDSFNGISVGDEGTLLKANADGLSWSVQETGLTGDLMDICILQPNKAWVVGHKGTILHSDDYGVSWESQYDDTALFFNSVFFLDGLFGWVAGGNNQGESVILNTSNGGDTWQEISGGAYSPLSVIFFNDNDIGWAVMSDGKAYKTFDGGVTWVLKFPEPNSLIELKDIFFTDSDQGWVVGKTFWVPLSNSVIYHTSDGGENWSSQEDNSWRGFNGVFFTDPEHGCAVGNYGSICCTPNGGENWVVLAGSYILPELFDVCFVDLMEGWAVGGSQLPGNATLMHTLNGGETWDPSEVGNNVLYSVYFINAQRGWIVGGPASNNSHSIIMQTTDGGLNWDSEIEETGVMAYRDVFFIDGQKGWVVGGTTNVSPPQGSIFLSTIDGGLSWEDQSWISEKCLTKICFDDNDYGWITGDGVILHSPDGGESWLEFWTGEHSWKTMCFVGNDHAWFVGDSIYGSDYPDLIMLTTNGGLSWEKQYFNWSIHGIFFIDEYKGWLVGENGAVFCSENGGQSWEPMISTTTQALHEVFFAHEGKGWAVGNNATILTCFDGSFSTYPENQSFGKRNELSVYPNPMESQTTIEILLVHPSKVNIALFHVNGQFLETLYLKEHTTGKHSLNWMAQGYKKGTYIINMETDSGSTACKILIK